ncbi:4-oxalocrotonate decarboxylase (plasmid) [Paraburkholderia phymatum STM815]|uniref:4-oxalocrotonate decarboxylase n=1 Tax=Paraburkholderia phymatum (strain DSM 17167 / CIP 108236 / LMG 21445 / STM815) TaxID=391038 RepID=B2JST3_PARP8|nr:4-oxalocrotonate decarboxylase [Paraburkholderia phymatum STM815]
MLVNMRTASLWVKLKLAEGHIIKGRKIGLTSRAMQRSSQIDEPDYAPLLDSMFIESGRDIRADRFIAPRVEVELAFILAKPLRGPGVTLFGVLDATAYVSPAVEIIDARIEQFDRETKAPRKVFDTISDFAANAGIVMGGRPVRPMDVDLRWIGALLYTNGAVEESGLAAAVLNHPATGVAWLANKIAPYDEGLNANDVILSGSFTAPVPARRRYVSRRLRPARRHRVEFRLTGSGACPFRWRPVAHEALFDNRFSPLRAFGFFGKFETERLI